MFKCGDLIYVEETCDHREGIAVITGVNCIYNAFNKYNVIFVEGNEVALQIDEYFTRKITIEDIRKCNVTVGIVCDTYEDYRDLFDELERLKIYWANGDSPYEYLNMNRYTFNSRLVYYFGDMKAIIGIRDRLVYNEDKALFCSSTIIKASELDLGNSTLFSELTPNPTTYVDTEKERFDDIYRKHFERLNGRMFDKMHSFWEKIKPTPNEIKDIYVNKEKGTIVAKWDNGSTTKVTCMQEDTWDLEKGVAMLIAKYYLGNNYNAGEVFNRYLKKAIISENKDTKSKKKQSTTKTKKTSKGE